MRHTDIDCNAIQALARVDHRVAQVHLTVGLGLDLSDIQAGTSRNLTGTSGERQASFFFGGGGGAFACDFCNTWLRPCKNYKEIFLEAFLFEKRTFGFKALQFHESCSIKKTFSPCCC